MARKHCSAVQGAVRATAREILWGASVQLPRPAVQETLGSGAFSASGRAAFCDYGATLEPRRGTRLCLQPLQRLRDAACKACAAVAPHPDETACCVDRPPCRMHLRLHRKCSLLGVEALQLASFANATVSIVLRLLSDTRATTQDAPALAPPYLFSLKPRQSPSINDVAVNNALRKAPSSIVRAARQYDVCSTKKRHRQ